jgi:soluble lytic murein transglycosylase
MIIKRAHSLLFVSACLFGSPSVFSNSGPVNDSAKVEIRSAPVSVLNETRDDLKPGGVNTVSKVERASEASLKVSTDETAGEQRTFSEEELAELRALFVEAEEALADGDEDDYFELAEELEQYPLYPYLQYQWLRKNLQQEEQVKQFLQQNESSRYAGILKNRWLYHLARNGQWQTYLEYYTHSNDTSLKCYFRTAQFNNGDRQAALTGARELWSAGRSQPKACDPLFAKLKQQPDLFNQDLFWQRFEAAMSNNKTRLARYVKTLMPASDQATANLWLNLHRKPQQYLPDLLQLSSNAQAAAMFTHAVNRVANSDVQSAIEIWDSNKAMFAVSKAQADKLENRLALKLALENDPAAYDRLGQLDDSDYSSQSWRIRVALAEQDWPRVITAIQDLNKEDRQREKWQYWLARAYQQTGNQARAEELWTELSSKRDFYGYLAAERLNLGYQLSDNPVDVSFQEINTVKNHVEFRVAYELMALDRTRDAKLQWWHALRQLDKNEIPAAAKLAQQWEWDEIAIFTIAKVKHWDDIDLRFPLSYSDKIHENALQHNLDPVILFGLVRRESAFNKDAHSPVGARGLMQIMPKTARQIARDLNERWKGNNSLYDPVKNLKYGSYYYHKLLNQFNGHYALALAAYNAGPHRVKKWLPTESIPADIWIETIPFHETRDYVTSVLVYAMIYQQLIQSSNQLSMNDFTRAVQPLTDVALNQE